MNEVRFPLIKAALGPSWTVWFRCLVRGLGLPRWGNLRRAKPFSECWGFDRGSPVDRYYLHRFLERHSHAIRGTVLEVQDSIYTQRFGRDVVNAHTIDINPAHRPTFRCDLARSDGVIPSDGYDCFLLPNTLCFLQDLEESLRHALRVVRPGGYLLASGSTLVPFAPDARDGEDRWHLSAVGWQAVAKAAWPSCEPEIESHGNCIAAVAAMLGLAQEELSAEELDVNDPRYPVLVTIALRKPVPQDSTAQPR